MTRAVSFAPVLASAYAFRWRGLHTATLPGRSGGADAAPAAAELLRGVGR